MTKRRQPSSGRPWVAFAAGALVGVLASRVLPPLAAQAAGTARAAAGQDPFERLARDHRHILSLLTAMEQSTDDAVFRRTQLLLRLKRALAAHAMAEEDVVYPLLHDRAGAEADTKQLYSEHGDMKMDLFALEQMPKNDPRWRGRVGALRSLIARHVHQEEAVDFPRLRAVLDRQETMRLSGGMQREKALLL